jgi:hypothetical protein
VQRIRIRSIAFFDQIHGVLIPLTPLRQTRQRQLKIIPPPPQSAAPAIAPTTSQSGFNSGDGKVSDRDALIVICLSGAAFDFALLRAHRRMLRRFSISSVLQQSVCSGARAPLNTT